MSKSCSGKHVMKLGAGVARAGSRHGNGGDEMKKAGEIRLLLV
jgi:hypothetical protein